MPWVSDFPFRSNVICDDYKNCLSNINFVVQTTYCELKEANTTTRGQSTIMFMPVQSIF